MKSPRNTRDKRRSGQALVMMTLAVLALCGILGLAVDLGWSFYVKKNAQAAADAGALAAVLAAQRLGFSPPFTCGNATGKIYCTAPASCGDAAVSGNLNSACVYANLNGFTQGGNVNIVVQADVTTPAPTVPNVAVSYWVTVRVNQQIPQLFSAVLGNSNALVSARATAALTNVIFNASLDLLNRENDPNSLMGTGVDLAIQGGGNVQAPGGMLVASALNISSGSAAANPGGSGKVTNTPFSDFRGTAGACVGNGGSNCDVGPAGGDWSQPPTYGVPDGNTFQDPTSLGNAKMQPPLDTTQDNICPVAGGNLSPKNVPATCTANGGKSLAPGLYYAAVSSKDNTATGAQLSFSDSTTTFSNNGVSFGQYVFYGGLTTSAGNQTINLVPGRYVIAGTTVNNPEFFVDNKTIIQDQNTGATQTDGGELFIFTNAQYSWAGGSMPDGTPWSTGGLTLNNMTPPAVAAYGVDKFAYGQGGFSFKSGDNSGTKITLWGVNPDGTGVPAAGGMSGPLVNYENFLFWQDRGNSTVAYNPDGTINWGQESACFGCTLEIPSASPSINNPYTNLPSTATSPQMNLWASPNAHLHGYLYQPRGAWLNLQGSGKLNGPLRIITGALSLQGSPTVILTGTSVPITITETALIE